MTKLIYDGDCGFCTRVAKFGERHKKRDYESLSWQSIESELKDYGLTQSDVMQRVYWVDDNQQVYGGASALFQASKNLRFPFQLFSLLSFIPGVSFIAEPIYRFVAKNRYRLPESTDSCRLDLEEEDTRLKNYVGLYMYLGKNAIENYRIDALKITDLDYSYPEVGACGNRVPDGYTFDVYKGYVGKGREAFEYAIHKFKAFECHNKAGLLVAPDDFEFKKGSSAFFGMKITNRLVLGFPDRIVYIKELKNLFECAYGTLEGHPEQGEEVFRISIDKDEVVTFEIECFSKIVSPIARLGYPVSRYLQRNMTRKYIKAIAQN